MKKLIISLFIIASVAHAQQFDIKCSDSNSSGFSSKVSCLASHLRSKLRSCTTNHKLLSLNYEVTSCSISAAGYAHIGGSKFYLCRNMLNRSRDQFYTQYNSRSNSEEITEYLFESLIFYTMIHESVHLAGYQHSNSMDSQVESLLQCVGERSIFSAYGQFANWTLSIPVLAPDLGENIDNLDETNCPVTTDLYNFCKYPYQLQIKTNSLESCTENTNKALESLAKSKVQVSKFRGCSMVMDKDLGWWFAHSNIYVEKEIKNLEVYQEDEVWPQGVSCKKMIEVKSKELIESGYFILQVPSCFNGSSKGQQILIRYI